MTKPTEEQIERQVEWAMNQYDARLMAGKLSQADYDLLVKRLSKWVDAQYYPLTDGRAYRKAEGTS